MCAVFLLGGLSAVFGWTQTSAYMSAREMPSVPILLAAAVAVELLGGFCLLIGWKTRLMALVLLFFLIPTTVIFHDFWASPAAQRQDQMQHFYKNLAIMGGLLLLSIHGAGRISVDARTEQ
jgi:putative oxidoreductase